ncbi:MAG: hypothetical protein ACREWI_09365 [Telluria sp.]
MFLTVKQNTEMHAHSFEVIPIHERLKAVIVAETDESGRFGWLQKKTGISRNTWQTWWDKVDSSPSGKMVEAAARLWPKYGFWLATGMTDEEYGHTFPKTLPKSTTWPEYEGREIRGGGDYFGHCVMMQSKKAADDYADPVAWERDWEKLNELSWQREIEIHALRLIGGSYEDRIKTQSAKLMPWQPDDGNGVHEYE